MAHPVDYDQFLRMYNYMRLNLPQGAISGDSAAMDSGSDLATG
jgi:hypothetical protein